MCGTQWPQARLHSTGRAADPLCVLCGSEIGTLRHRLVCPGVRPPEGWPPPSRRAAAGLHLLGPARVEALELRGMAR
eukprot:11045047-Lingulodinium_polyedra.AAC.1